MSEPLQIIGIALVRNEDRFLARAIGNVLGFCDHVLIADNGSTDGTWELAQELARKSPKVVPHRIHDPRESEDMLRRFANTRTWVLGVDGDEIYDPAGLGWTRSQIESGAWDRWWTVFGNVCNCVELDERAGVARGHLAPPCRSMTKLYNFGAIESLDPASPQRLMGRNNVYKPGHEMLDRYDLHAETDWDAARFRCLHACFLPRSSRDIEGRSARENITELRKYSVGAWLRRIAAKLTGREAESQWKMEKYRRGPLVTVDAKPFFP